MRKFVSIAIVSMASLLALPAFAQSDSSENMTYAQKVQKMFDQSNAEAKKQFDKSYPKPTAPVIPNTATGSETYKPPVAPKNVTPPPVKDNVASRPQPVVNPPPDININSGKNPQNSAQQNIFMPSGSATPDNNASAPNPYR